MMLRKIIALNLLLIVSLTYGADSKADKLEWLPLGEAIELSKSEEKPVYVYLFRNACGWCKRFRKQTLADKLVIRHLNEDFIISELNSSSTAKQKFKGEMKTQRQLAAMFAVRGVPTSAFLDGEGKIIAKLPGYLPPDKFLAVLKYFGKGWYKDMTYQEFLQSEEKLKQKDK